MFNISSFLGKFSRHVQYAELEKQHILEVIEKQVSLKLDIKDLEIKNYVLEIHSTPGIKNKLFIHKEQLLKEVNAILSVKIVDIK